MSFTRRPRSRAAPAHPPWITHPGKLGGPGYLSKTDIVRHRLLNACIARHGWNSCRGSVAVLQRPRVMQHNPMAMRKLSNDLRYIYHLPH